MSKDGIDWSSLKSLVDSKGYAVVPNIFNETEVTSLLSPLETTTTSDKPAFRKDAQVYAVRQFLKELPAIKSIVFNAKLRELVANVFGQKYFVVKSIYFDKPESSNWFVSYHQDLTISVREKKEVAGYGPWTVKQNQFGVQPPMEVLEKNFTIRIHLDETNSENGALKVLAESHKNGVIRIEDIGRINYSEEVCDVPPGGVMIMKPLLFHSSGRTTNNKRRRVIHIEFSDSILPQELEWAERLTFN